MPGTRRFFANALQRMRQHQPDCAPRRGRAATDPRGPTRRRSQVRALQRPRSVFEDPLRIALEREARLDALKIRRLLTALPESALPDDLRLVRGIGLYLYSGDYERQLRSSSSYLTAGASRARRKPPVPPGPGGFFLFTPSLAEEEPQWLQIGCLGACHSKSTARSMPFPSASPSGNGLVKLSRRHPSGARSIFGTVTKHSSTRWTPLASSGCSRRSSRRVSRRLRSDSRRRHNRTLTSFANSSNRTLCLTT